MYIHMYLLKELGGVHIACFAAAKRPSYVAHGNVHAGAMLSVQSAFVLRFSIYPLLIQCDGVILER